MLQSMHRLQKLNRHSLLQTKRPAMLYKLYKILNSGSNSFSGIFEGFKKGPKGILKSIFLILFMLYVFGVMIGMYTVYMIGTYKYLAGNGTQQLMPMVTMLVAVAVIMFFGFTSVASTYYTGTGEEFLMSLPLTPGQFFGAKFAVSFVSDAIMGVGMFAIGSIVYGYNEGLLLNPLFYLGFLVSAIAFSVTSVFIIYLLFVVILYFVPALRKKKLLTILATILVIIFCMFYGMMNSSISLSFTNNSSISLSFTNPEFVNDKIGSSIDKISEFGTKTPVFAYIAGALNGKIIPILILAALSALILFVLAVFTLDFLPFHVFDLNMKRLSPGHKRLHAARLQDLRFEALGRVCLCRRNFEVRKRHRLPGHVDDRRKVARSGVVSLHRLSHAGGFDDVSLLSLLREVLLCLFRGLVHRVLQALTRLAFKIAESLLDLSQQVLVKFKAYKPAAVT